MARTAVALLITGPRHGKGTQAVGLLALIGAASMFLGPSAGRGAGRYGSDRVDLWRVPLALTSGVFLLTGLTGGPAGIVGPAACRVADDGCGVEGRAGKPVEEMPKPMRKVPAAATERDRMVVRRQGARSGWDASGDRMVDMAKSAPPRPEYGEEDQGQRDGIQGVGGLVRPRCADDHQRDRILWIAPARVRCPRTASLSPRRTPHHRRIGVPGQPWTCHFVQCAGDAAPTE
ncbi:hypothetical protein ACGFNV_01875 [Streptomyces sp. NPDC048751]|uniref:hypothetical protein n=1 Tax=Streptomyces sp. NPDC048751 TaxID=3365591 RepID=UPI00371D4EFB